jgi:tRNA/rRNA methyltransferase
MGFKRQTPVGSHIVDFVSFPLRTVIDLRPEAETAGAARNRADRRTWLIERGYRVVDVDERAIETALQQVVDCLAKDLRSAEADQRTR